MVSTSGDGAPSCDAVGGGQGSSRGEKKHSEEEDNNCHHEGNFWQNTKYKCTWFLIMHVPRLSSRHLPNTIGTSHWHVESILKNGKGSECCSEASDSWSETTKVYLLSSYVILRLTMLMEWGICNHGWVLGLPQSARDNSTVNATETFSVSSFKDV